MKRWGVILWNVVAFDVLWTVAVIGATRPWWWAGPLLVGASFALQLTAAPRPGREAVVVLGGAALGVLLDLAAASIGLLLPWGSSSTPQFLLVFFALWVNFGTTLRPSLRWLWERPAAAAALGAVGGPLSYWIGTRLGAVSFAEPIWRGLAWCSVQYAFALPVWMYAARRVIPDAVETTRTPNSPTGKRAGGTPA